jgi:hypothetical protein
LRKAQEAERATEGSQITVDGSSSDTTIADSQQSTMAVADETSVKNESEKAADEDDAEFVDYNFRKLNKKSKPKISFYFHFDKEYLYFTLIFAQSWKRIQEAWQFVHTKRHVSNVNARRE